MAITKEQLTKVRERMNAVLSDLATEFGAELRVGQISYSANSATIKVEMSTLDESGEVVTKEAEDFKANAPLYGLKVDDLYREFSHLGQRYMVMGCKTRSHKYPILCKNLTTGSMSKFPTALAQRYLA